MNRAATLALAPLSSIYGAVTKVRRVLYQRGVLSVRELGVPVISVGNLTTGGTGKTPLVEWIAAELAGRERRVCILTRGYGRADQNQRVVVSNGQQILFDAEEAGDEPLLLAERLKGRASVISDVDRVSAARWAKENLSSDVFVLDDGFQNLRIARNLNIVTVDATKPWGNGRLLPAGILREPRTEVSRADCIVITRADQSTQTESLQHEIEELSRGGVVLSSRMKIRGLRPGALSTNDAALASDRAQLESNIFGAFCGIGSPQSFFSQLRRDGYRLGYTESFPDHHRYDQRDIDRVTRESIARGAQALLTTAKDEVKLRSLHFNLPCYAADIVIEIEHQEELKTLIGEAISIKT